MGCSSSFERVLFETTIAENKTRMPRGCAMLHIHLQAGVNLKNHPEFRASSGLVLRISARINMNA